MEEYIQGSLAAGIIRPSSSPAGAGGFFVKKQDKTLRTVFSKLDLRKAYHLVCIREGDEWKTAFNTPTGHYEYLVMPFDLTNAPAVFQTLINNLLRDMLDKFFSVYLDDILIFFLQPGGACYSRQICPARLMDSSLYVKAEKCKFNEPSASFLGFIIAKDRLLMDPAKVSAVTYWPGPGTRKQLQRFLGFANFY